MDFLLSEFYYLISAIRTAWVTRSVRVVLPFVKMAIVPFEWSAFGYNLLYVSARLVSFIGGIRWGGITKFALVPQFWFP